MRPLAVVVALVSCAAGTPTVASPPPERTPYALVVERYADGDRSRATRDLVALEARHLPGDARALVGRLRLLADERLRNLLVKAATLLHTDAAIGLRAGGEPDGVDRHLALAGLYAQVADSFPADADLRSFTRRWYLAAALNRMRYLEVAGARPLLGEGLKRFPADPDLRLALGSIEETLGTWPLPLPVSPAGVSRDDRKTHLEAAEKEYRAALAANPDLMEPRLRRGRVLLLLGQRPEAAGEIDRALRDANDPALRYLALLLQGRLREDGDDLAGAAEAYRAAATLSPDGQTAYVALGHVLDRLGDLPGSRAALDRAVAKSSRLFVPLDPWWVYPYGQSSRADSLLAELRIEARR